MKFSFLPMIVVSLSFAAVALVAAFFSSDYAQKKWNSEDK